MKTNLLFVYHGRMCPSRADTGVWGDSIWHAVEYFIRPPLGGYAVMVVPMLEVCPLGLSCMT